MNLHVVFCYEHSVEKNLNNKSVNIELSEFFFLTVCNFWINLANSIKSCYAKFYHQNRFCFNIEEDSDELENRNIPALHCATCFEHFFKESFYKTAFVKILDYSMFMILFEDFVGRMNMLRMILSWNCMSYMQYLSVTWHLFCSQTVLIPCRSVSTDVTS